MTVSMSVFTFALLPKVGAHAIARCNLAQVLFIAALIISSLVGPLIFWRGWRWKTRRGGGWDAAVVRVKRSRLEKA